MKIVYRYVLVINFVNSHTIFVFFQKKGGNVKTIPPYKPIPTDNGSSDSSPEKESETPVKLSSSNVKRKSSNLKPGNSAPKRKSSNSPSLEQNGVLDDENKIVGNTFKDSSANSSKFTTSNFVETIVTQSESVFGHENTSTTTTTVPSMTLSKLTSNSHIIHKSVSNSKSGNSTSNKTSTYTSKKRKIGAQTPTTIGNENSNQSTSFETSESLEVTTDTILQQISANNVQTTVTEAITLSTLTEQGMSKKVSIFEIVYSSTFAVPQL